MFLTTTTILAGVILFLPYPSLQSCISGTIEHCQRAEIAPGSSLVGEGFDITTMQRKGAFVIDMDTFETPNKTCTLCANPYRGGKIEKIPTSVINWRPLHKCSIAIKSELLESALAVADHVSKSVENNWKIGLGLSKGGYGGSLALSGTNSKLTTTAMEKSKQDRFNFLSHSVYCGFYSYMMSSNPNLNQDFKQAVEKLPQIYSPSNKVAYDAFIDTYGTHFIRKVKTGGKIVSMTSIRECKASMMGLSSDEVKMCLGAEVAVKIPYKVDIDLSAEIKFCNGKKEKVHGRRSFSSVFNDRITEITGGQTEGELLFSAGRDASAYKKWLASLPVSPGVISYTLKPLHQLIPDRKVKRELKQAIKDYILSRGAKRECSDHCSLGRRTKPRSCECHCQSHKGLGTNCCPTRPGLAIVAFTIIRGQGLYGDTASGTDGYVKIFDENKIPLGKTPMILNNDNPYWNWELNIGDMLLSANSKLRIEVWDEDDKYDDLLGTCLAKLQSGGDQGERVCALNHGVLFYKLKVTCGPSLSGPSCAEYVSSPMDSLLEKLYVSRHARPIPKRMLFQMGLRLDGQAFNYMLTDNSSVLNGDKADWL
ncbi:perforin-1-like [Alosa sapidissima]|uniref:perforin-1-like n=1 Tax=Alosa sapidissima TaxID=34773 RepID=UPI001C09C6C0|nr:perforin-1-like [Alosa sapidissima]XP_041931816.1 perforin-1-like [Alosa sapidissima]XP_041931817.1 perforin-1-like [Alosa sapidissima]XP_041943456.1 perforin-1-like [Alosa sapidissima]XP_041943457.1 perforin-1-like [Alosa sapidissima]XP_041943458.1 perforin-1-like [Alosa sapidissima]